MTFNAASSLACLLLERLAVDYGKMSKPVFHCVEFARSFEFVLDHLRKLADNFIGLLGFMIFMPPVVALAMYGLECLMLERLTAEYGRNPSLAVAQ